MGQSCIITKNEKKQFPTGLQSLTWPKWLSTHKLYTNSTILNVPFGNFMSSMMFLRHTWLRSFWLQLILPYNDNMFYLPFFRVWTSINTNSEAVDISAAGLLLHRCERLTGWGAGPSLTVWGAAKPPSGRINSLPPPHAVAVVPTASSRHLGLLDEIYCIFWQSNSCEIESHFLLLV